MRINYSLPFPKRFRLLIDETKVSQQEIADYVGVSRQAVAQWKDGKTAPDIYNFKKIAEFFKVPYEYLMGETESKVKENMRLAAELKLDDRAINRISKWASAEKENKSDITRSEILSDLLAENTLELFIDCVRKFISEYFNRRFHEDEPNNDELTMLTGIALELTPYELDVYARSIGFRAVSEQELSDLFRQQAVEVLNRAVKAMPEDYYVAYCLAKAENAARRPERKKLY